MLTVHITDGWILCAIILVLFDAGLGSQSFYEQNVVYVWSSDNFDVGGVFSRHSVHSESADH